MKQSLSDILQNAVDAMTSALHTSIPAIIEAYDKTSQKASVQPAIQKKFKFPDGIEQNLQPPVITDVPVIFPSGRYSSLTFPLEKGDGVQLLFCERAIERWLASGGVTENGVPRRYDLKDAVAIPGIRPFNAETITAGTSLALKHHKAKIIMTEDSKIQIGNNSIELLTWLDDLVQKIEGITVEGKPIDNIADFVTLRNELSKLRV